jgi:hypothetical protein
MRLRLQQRTIERFPLMQHGGEAEVLCDVEAHPGSEAKELFRRELRDCVHGGGESVGISDGSARKFERCREKRADRGDVGDDCGQFGCGSLEERHGEAFPKRAEDKGIRCLHAEEDVFLESEEMRSGSDAEVGGEAAEFAFERAGAGDQQTGTEGKFGEGAKEGAVILYGIEPADGEPDEIVAEI